MVKNCDLTIKIGSLSIKNGKKADLTKNGHLMNEHWYMILGISRNRKTISFKLASNPF
jgi:hypothetical protein